ncbi:hypothetical protein GCWU000341_02291 [Oribacterium sp. oral taxon 078 str. F0262]|uniref:hypothetical protein n=1 Tax=Oribacterium sp. oral taxon 078 TaxID=652706 RepID=UPI0001BCBDD7|nr:hypothetical protein [Oribacterium sp. oral taxon 078]EFE91183.1 hypothetical protein GCWU000341_02291 [Oribacterium sp. oral taxon 078 str. F0262]
METLERGKERLKQLSYTWKASDEALLSHCCEKAASYVKNECNTEEVPEGLLSVTIDIAVGEFLKTKKTFSPNDLSGLDFSAVVTQIKEGDTDVSFSEGKSTEQRLDEFISYLLSYGTPQFSCYRRLRW